MSVACLMDKCYATCSWEDGSPVKQVLTSVDRWRIQNALQVTVRVSSANIKIAQQVCAFRFPFTSITPCYMAGV